MTPEELRAALPPLDGTLRVAGLAGPVEVLRDPEGVPHIRADRASATPSWRRASSTPRTACSRWN